jgi:threonine/homoserine/homoserine lactone efflux protein
MVPVRLAIVRSGELSIAFIVTALIIVVTPGTGALYTISAGLSRGARASVVAAFGCTLGIVPHLTAAVTGTAALLRASGVAFEVVKFLGVGYLLFMAWASWRDRTPLVVDHLPGDKKSAWQVIASAILLNLLNPKLTLFFFAFLPQFVPPGSPDELGRLLELSAVFMVMTFVVFTCYGVFAASVRRHLVDRPVIVARVRKVFAASFVALGVRLAVTAR